MPATASAFFMRIETAKAVAARHGFQAPRQSAPLMRCRQLSGDRECPLDSGFEFLQLDRFGEMLGKSGLQTSFDITVMAEAADRDSRNLRDGAQLHHQFHPGSIRKGNIANEQIEFIAN